jgi:hypothetical protein
LKQSLIDNDCTLRTALFVLVLYALVATGVNVYGTLLDIALVSYFTATYNGEVCKSCDCTEVRHSGVTNLVNNAGSFDCNNGATKSPGILLMSAALSVIWLVMTAVLSCSCLLLLSYKCHDECLASQEEYINDDHTVFPAEIHSVDVELQPVVVQVNVM